MVPLLDDLLDPWDRNSIILVNLLGALPDEALEVRPMADSPSIGELFSHIHYVRMVFVEEDAPEFAGRPMSDDEAGPLTWGMWMKKGTRP